MNLIHPRMNTSKILAWLRIYFCSLYIFFLTRTRTAYYTQLCYMPQQYRDYTQGMLKSTLNALGWVNGGWNTLQCPPTFQSLHAQSIVKIIWSNENHLKNYSKF